MNIYEETFDFLLNLLPTQDWPEANTVLERAAAKVPRDWRLPVIGCEAVGGEQKQAIPAVAAIACSQISIILVDDMLDDDPRGEYHRIGAAATANLAIAFQAAGLEAIIQSRHQTNIRLATLHGLNKMMFTTAFGQYLDTQNPEDQEAYWRLVRSKSSPFFGTALEVGALLGGATAETGTQLKRLGHLYGEIIQIHDDLNDTMAVPANPDWTMARSPLPLLFAQVVEHPQRARFLELRKAVSDPDALKEAQSILISCGAISYSVDELLRRYQAAQEILTTASLAHKDGLESILEDVVNPVRKLFAAIGIAEPDALLKLPDLVT